LCGAGKIEGRGGEDEWCQTNQTSTMAGPFAAMSRESSVGNAQCSEQAQTSLSETPAQEERITLRSTPGGGIMRDGNVNKQGRKSARGGVLTCLKTTRVHGGIGGKAGRSGRRIVDARRGQVWGHNYASQRNREHPPGKKKDKNI